MKTLQVNIANKQRKQGKYLPLYIYFSLSIWTHSYSWKIIGETLWELPIKKRSEKRRKTKTNNEDPTS